VEGNAGLIKKGLGSLAMKSALYPGAIRAIQEFQAGK